MKAILMYHSIDPSGSVVSVHPDRFRAHVDFIHARGIPTVPIPELLQPRCEEGIALTFDDAFENFASVAWPLLRDRGLCATVYVATDWVGGENAWDPDDHRVPRLPLMGWETIGRLAEEDLVVGSHTRTHARLPSLDDSALAEELESSMGRIRSEIGIAPSSLAYPYGDYDERVARAADSAGLAFAVTTQLRPLGSGELSPFTLPRLDAYYLARPGVMEAWGTRRFRNYLAFRNAARRMRRALAGLVPGER